MHGLLRERMAAAAAGLALAQQHHAVSSVEAAARAACATTRPLRYVGVAAEAPRQKPLFAVPAAHRAPRVRRATVAAKPRGRGATIGCLPQLGGPVPAGGRTRCSALRHAFVMAGESRLCALGICDRARLRLPGAAQLFGSRPRPVRIRSQGLTVGSHWPRVGRPVEREPVNVWEVTAGYSHLER